MRGKPQVLGSVGECPRNIPAHAGKTYVGVGWVSTPQEHPRACGENEWLTPHLPSRGGTSPRMRGKLNYDAPAGSRDGNIPAHAGKTFRVMEYLTPDQEHPRACGENSLSILSIIHRRGTSPRMRGKPDRVRSWVVAGRNIPAHAGKTGGGHPESVRKTGTSPRMRGKRFAQT